MSKSFKLTQIALEVRDLSRALDFYKSGLGAELVHLNGHFAFLALKNFTLLLSQNDEKDIPHQGLVHYFEVENSRIILNFENETGIALEREAKWTEGENQEALLSAYFRCPDGYLWGLLYNSNQNNIDTHLNSNNVLVQKNTSSSRLPLRKRNRP